MQKQLKDGTIEQFVWNILRTGTEHYINDLVRRVQEFKDDQQIERSNIINCVDRIRSSGVIPAGREIVAVAKGRTFAYRLVRPVSVGE